MDINDGLKTISKMRGNDRATIVAFANHKGGVGKTTTVASVGSALARDGYRVLLVDLDAQANLTFSLLGESEDRRTIYHALREQNNLPIVEVLNNLSIVPSGLEMAGVELEISGVMSREYVLKDLLNTVATDYNVILLDCPPSLGLIVVNAFASADHVVVPTTAEALPLKGLKMLEQIMQMVQARINPTLSLLGVVLTKWGARRLNKMVADAIEEGYTGKVFATKIRENVAVAEAPLSRLNIFDYSPESNGAKDYFSLTKELEKRLFSEC